MTHTFGWIPDLPDQRDYPFNLSLLTVPTVVDLRPNCSPVYDQGQLGSCTAQAIAEAMWYDMKKEGKLLFNPSRLFIYYNERVMENTVNTDSGASIRDGIKTVNKQGVCDEILWPYDISMYRVPPAKDCYVTALLDTALSYQRVARTMLQMQTCLASGLPFVVGISVYASFESGTVAHTGLVPIPSKREQLLGGHAILIVGYDSAAGVFIFRNSWGATWGDKGYGYLPLSYLLDRTLSSDFWVIRVVGA